MTGWPFLSTFAGADVVLGLDVQPCVAIIESSLMLVGMYVDDFVLKGLLTPQYSPFQCYRLP